jgi:REP element-mobilizing transposase RayT
MTSKRFKAPLCSDKFYHIYNRGNNKERLFYSSSDYFFFMAKYKKYISPFAETYAFCLLPNHFHFLIKTGYENGVQKSVVPNQLRKLFICYTFRINYFQRRTGGLFTKNYQRIKVDNDNYLTQVVRYIHKNPCKHKIQKDFENYSYSSYKIIIKESPTLLNRDEVLNWFGSKDEFIRYHRDDQVDPTGFNFLNIEEDDEMESL